MSFVVVVFFGAPGSGKSSLCQAVQQTLVDQRRNALLIEFDQFEKTARKENHQKQNGDFDVKSWKAGRSVALSELRTALETAVSDQYSEHLVLLDDTFHLRSMRKELFKIVSQYFAEVHFVFVDTTASSCIARNRQRQKLEKRISEKVTNKGAQDIEIGPLPTDEVVESHCKILNDSCFSWRTPPIESSQSSDTQLKSVSLVPLKARYKWERKKCCFCWRVNGEGNTPDELARELLTAMLSDAERTWLCSQNICQDEPGEKDPNYLETRINVLDKQLRRCIHNAISESSIIPYPETIRNWNQRRIAMIKEFRLRTRIRSDWQMVHDEILDSFEDYVRHPENDLLHGEGRRTLEKETLPDVAPEDTSEN